MGQIHRQYIIRGEMYIREGECNQCGECCLPPTKERLQSYADAGFEVEVQYEDGCPSEVRGEGGKITCTDYEHRNQMCRDFPQFPVDIVALPNCSFSFKKQK